MLDSDIFVGTVRADSHRLILSLGAEYDLDLVSHDIKIVFLYSDLQHNKDIYLRRPTGVNDDIMPFIVTLKKNVCMNFLNRANILMNTYLRDYLLWDLCQ